MVLPEERLNKKIKKKKKKKTTTTTTTTTTNYLKERTRKFC
jgi:hypothetical protein